MAEIDLNALASLPGFGTAKKVLKEAGHWDEFAADDSEKRTWVVKMTASVPATATVKVQARSQKEAEALAGDLVQRNKVDWEADENDANDIEFVDVRGIE